MALVLLCLIAQSDLADIVKRLDSDRPEIRDAAQAGLRAACRRNGPDLLPTLREHAKTASLEVRARLKPEIEFLERVDSYADILDVFASIGVPDVAGKAWGRLRDDSRRHRVGWLLARTDREVEVLMAGELRPTKFAVGSGFEALDFAASCRAFIDEYKDVFAIGSADFIAVEAALRARGAIQAREFDVADELMGFADARFTRSGRETVQGALVGAVSIPLRARAIVDASNGAARPDLLKRWRVLAEAFPEGTYAEEASAMVRRYEQAVREDEDRSVSRQGDWIYALRDLDAKQFGEPGDVYVVGPFAMRESKESPNPAEKLMEAGWDALPEIVEHIDDPTPTRSMHCSRSWHSASFRLLTVGDCCKQVFEALTGVDASDPNAARRWWKEAEEAGPESFYLNMLDREQSFFSPSLTAQAAAALLRIDPGRHKSAVLDRYFREETWKAGGLLPLVIPHLTIEDSPRLLEVLKGEDLDDGLLAAQALWSRFDDPAGPRALVDLLKRLPATLDNSKFESTRNALEFLRTVSDSEVQEALPGLRFERRPNE